MDRYRSLYKENSSLLSPRQHNRINRDLQNVNRAKKRKQTFQSGRNFAVSPTPQKNYTQLEKSCSALAQSGVQILQNKENHLEATTEKLVGADVTGAPQVNKSRIALAVTSYKASEKLSRQDAYFMRFIEFKARKQKEMQCELDTKKRPFVPVGSNSGTSKATKNSIRLCGKGPSAAATSFVPHGHSEFEPPKGLKNPLLEQVAAISGCSENNKLRRSMYMAVPTPPRKDKKVTPSKSTSIKPINWKTPSASKAVSTAIVKSTSSQRIAPLAEDSRNPLPSIVTSWNDVDTKQKTVNRVLTYSTAVGAKNGAITCTSRPKPLEVVKNPVANQPPKVNAANRQPANLPPPLFAKPLAPPPPPSVAVARKASRILKPTRVCNGTNAPKPGAAAAGGALGKAYQLQSKRDANTARLATQKNAKLSVSLKAKKPTASRPASSVAKAAAIAAKIKSSKVPSAKVVINGKTKSGGTQTAAATASFLIADTPTNIFNLNSFDFVTSTKVKSLSPRTAKPLIISPVNNVQCANKPLAVKADVPSVGSRSHNNASSAKRALLQNKEQKKTRNFNFVRYSVGKTDVSVSEVEPQKESVIDTLTKSSNKQDEVNESGTATTTSYETVVEQKKVQAKESSVLANHNKNQESAILHTPPSAKTHAYADRPANYLSPFVSVSRGKVSAKKEREKRDSIYLQNVSPDKEKPIDAPSDVDVRRTLEAIRYFRLQLAGEIERLHGVCNQWDEYKAEHLRLLQETGGEDMINVTIGQTKLLTSKKFQQFNGLIDRCEAGVHNAAAGIAPTCDGSEATKLITAVDLEGFWSMLNLQVDNVDKRFENLTRWKNNNWTDPDEAQEKLKTKAKPNLHKVKKPKPAAKSAKPSSGLQEMLRKMHAEMRKNKAAAVAAAAKASTDASALNRMLTPTRQRRSISGTPKLNNGGGNSGDTPLRISVVVRDRKSLSAAATVVSIPATNAVVAAAVAAQRRRSRNSIDVESSKSLITSVKDLRRSISKMETASGRTDILRAALLNGLDSAQKQKRRSGAMDVSAKSTPPPTSPSSMGLGRKSILKTPGTAKGKPKNVNFSERLRVKKFKFTLDDEQSDDEEIEEKMKNSLDGINRSTAATLELHIGEEDSEQRTYQLRTRKVVLRPSSEFEVPRS